MRKLLLSGIALAVLAGVRRWLPIYKPGRRSTRRRRRPCRCGRWTGCYIGGHLGGGYAWTENTNTVNTTVFGDFGPGQGYANHSSGFVGGGHLGCNYQVARMVIGIEGSYLTVPTSSATM